MEKVFVIIKLEARTKVKKFLKDYLKMGNIKGKALFIIIMEKRN